MKRFEGYHEGVLVIVGTEVSTTAGHVLGLGIPDPVYRFFEARDALLDVRDLGGFAFAAHPLSPRADLAFTGWDLPGSWGLELLNGDSEWRQAGARLGATILLYGLNQDYALLQSLSPPEATLARWDKILLRRDAPGIVAADAHSRVPVTRKWSVRWPSYEALPPRPELRATRPPALGGGSGRHPRGAQVPPPGPPLPGAGGHGGG